MSRSIAYRSSGINHGLITRIINPSREGDLLKPFIFLDYINGQPPKRSGFGWHPHSGIATVTYYVEGSTDIEESTGNKVHLGVRDIEYLEAGNGVWHKGQIRDDSYARGFQLWFALPPERQQQDPTSIFLKHTEITKDDSFYLILGKYKGLVSSIVPPLDLNYLEVNLSKGQSWMYLPPSNHDTLFIFLFDGDLAGDVDAQRTELFIFDKGNSPLELRTLNGAKFLLGSAQRFDHELITKGSSIHTSLDLLRNSMQRIHEIKYDAVSEK